MINTEIERKFLLDKLPPIEGAQRKEIHQGYMPCGLRIRICPSEETILNLKSEGTLERGEWETPIPSWVQKLLWPQTVGRRVRKTRYLVPYGEHTLEVDEFHDHAGLWILECEFKTREQAQEFVLPDWAEGSKEVTGDPRYFNLAL